MWCRSTYPSLPMGFSQNLGVWVGHRQAQCLKELCFVLSPQHDHLPTFLGENLATNIDYYGQQETFPFSASLWLRNSLNGQSQQTSHSLQKARGKAEHGMPREWGTVGVIWGAPAATVLSFLPAHFWTATHLGRTPGAHLYPGGLASL